MELVRQASAAVQRATWPRERTRASYCRRSPRQVLREGELLFTAPCAELSSLTALGLLEAGLAPTLVLTAIQRALQPVKFQCGLELELEGERWVIGFAIAASYCYRGHFVETKRRPLVLRYDAARVDPERPFLEWLLPGGFDEVASVIPGYDLATDVAQHARRGASRWRYAWSRRKAADAGRAARGGRVPGGAGRWA
ncbi:MAG: hypothetical protein KDD82_11125 [Planctomycetes bacterium]|nr:hypothetical protein [Planctomycetota bacterium]